MDLFEYLCLSGLMNVLWDGSTPPSFHLIHTSSVIDVGDGGSSGVIFCSSSFLTCEVLGCLLLGFSSTSLRFTSSSQAFHLIRPFTCPLALIHLMCWQHCRLPVRFQKTTHSAATCFPYHPLFPSFVLLPLYLSATPWNVPLAHKHQLVQNPHFAIYTVKQTHTCACSLLKGFYRSLPGCLSTFEESS